MTGDEGEKDNNKHNNVMLIIIMIQSIRTMFPGLGHSGYNHRTKTASSGSNHYNWWV